MPKIPASDKLDTPEQVQPDQAQLPGPADGGAAFDADHAARTAQVNEGWVKNAQAGWLDGMNTLLYHPDTGYLNQRGAPAVGGYGSLQDAMGKLYQQTVDSLADDNQRGMFERSTAPLLGAFQGQARQHAESQCRIFDADASQARLRSALGLAVNAYTPGESADNALYRSSAAIAHNELENSFRHAHGDPAAENNQSLWEHYLQFGPDGSSGMCAIHTGIVNRLLESNQPDNARNYLDGIENGLPASVRDKLDQFIRTGSDRQQALNAVLQAQARSADPVEQQKALDGMRDNGKIDEAVHALAQHSLQAAQQQQLAVQKQNDEQALARVCDLKQASPNAALTDIPASTLAYLKSRGLDKNAEAILSGHPATDDPALFNQLHRLASTDPVKFAQASLIASSGRLSKAHLEYLQNLQDAINKQDPQAIVASTQVNDAVRTMQQEMKLSGIDLQAEPDSDREKQLAQAESGLRDRIIAAQQAKKGTPLTSDEVQNLAMGYFADQVLKGGDGTLDAPEWGVTRPARRNGANAAAATRLMQISASLKQAPSNGEYGQKFPGFSPTQILPHGAVVPATSIAGQNGLVRDERAASENKNASSVQVNGTTIHFLEGAKSQHITDHSLNVLADIARQSGLKEVWVTSTERTPSEQAETMYANLEGRKTGKNLYQNSGRQVEDVYRSGKKLGLPKSEIVAMMVSKIEQLGPETVSKHMGDFDKLNVMDISVNRMPRILERKMALLHRLRVPTKGLESMLARLMILRTT